MQSSIQRAIRWIMVGVLCCCALTVHARSPVWVWYDLDEWSFEGDTWLSGHDITVERLPQGVSLNFGTALTLTSYTPETVWGSIYAPMKFVTLKGWQIVGYEVTYTGGYFTEFPGWVGLSGPGIESTLWLNQPGSHAFTFTGHVRDPRASLLSGSFVASGNVEYGDDGQDDMGAAYVAIHGITIRALLSEVHPGPVPEQGAVSAVPEPGALGLLLLGLPLVALQGQRRRTRSASAHHPAASNGWR